MSQELIDEAEPYEKVQIPAGVYHKPIMITKPLRPVEKVHNLLEVG
ncbi:hypothetical protein J2S00_003835 [Caldalkalibacillus uzonensis]|uniref:Uncharacterized protein n=1 Tax=Caldalkalibacillus uzonensis TaxID=353224 RepID=A0ABU0CXW4_9BACI|nr:hypothetical protein [Caldalkalibacillus uzonensis]MDQ0340995.1 hypothetical protein [Caldalkalibacillus uzonensis]